MTGRVGFGTRWKQAYSSSTLMSDRGLLWPFVTPYNGSQPF